MMHALLLLSSLVLGAAQPKIKIQGSSTIAPVIAEAAEHFRNEGWKILVDTQGGSSGGLTALVDGEVDIAMSSKPLTDKDRLRFKNQPPVAHTLGYDGVALVVSAPVYEAGVTSLTLSQIREIYESRITRWKAVGGPDSPIVFYNKEPGRGTWEVFANWVYGSADKAPSVHFPEVGSNEEGRTKVAAHKSAITQLSASWAQAGKGAYALAIRGDSGPAIAPTPENIYSGKYPMKRPLLLITKENSAGLPATFIEYLTSPAGQELVAKHGYLPLTSPSP